MKTKNRMKQRIVMAVLGGVLVLLYMGCQAASAGDGGSGGDGGTGGGGGGTGPTTALVEGALALSGDAEGTASFSFEIPEVSASLKPKELRSATGMLQVNGTVGNFKIGLEGTYNSATGDYDLTAEGNLLGVFLSIVVRGKLDSNRNFVESYASLTTRDAEGNLRVATGTGAQKPATEGEVKNQIQNSGTSSVQRVSPTDAVLPQFLGTWYGIVPDFMNSVVPEHEEYAGIYTKIVLTVSSTTFTWRYSNGYRAWFDGEGQLTQTLQPYTLYHMPPIVGTIKGVYNSINSSDGSQQQHYVIEVPANQVLGPGQEGVKYINVRAKDVLTGRQINVYLDNGQATGEFPANVFDTLEDASSSSARTRQRDAITFRPWKQ